MELRLSLAVGNSNLEETKDLISQGADPSWPNPTDNGMSCVHLAAENGSIEILQYLAEVCLTPCQVTDSLGNTPLHYAASEGQLLVCEYLIEQLRVDPTPRNATLQTPADLAFESEFINIFHYIVHANQLLFSKVSKGKYSSLQLNALMYDGVIEKSMDLNDIEDLCKAGANPSWSNPLKVGIK